MSSPLPLNPCAAAFACAWNSHGRKHFPFRGMTKAHTLHGPSRYLPGTTEQDIKQLETATIQTGERRQRSEVSSEYFRDADAVIGWDRGQDAYVSFAECSGGSVSGRAYHGRPMAASNTKLEQR